MVCCISSTFPFLAPAGQLPFLFFHFPIFHTAYLLSSLHDVCKYETIQTLAAKYDNAHSSCFRVNNTSTCSLLHLHLQHISFAPFNGKKTTLVGTHRVQMNHVFPCCIELILVFNIKFSIRAQRISNRYHAPRHQPATQRHTFTHLHCTLTPFIYWWDHQSYYDN